MRGSILQLSAIEVISPKNLFLFLSYVPLTLFCYVTMNKLLLLYNVFCRLMQLGWKKKISNLLYNRQMSRDQRSV